MSAASTCTAILLTLTSAITLRMSAMPKERCSLSRLCRERDWYTARLFHKRALLLLRDNSLVYENPFLLIPRNFHGQGRGALGAFCNPLIVKYLQEPCGPKTVA